MTSQILSLVLSDVRYTSKCTKRWCRLLPGTELVAAILFTGGPDVIRNDAWSFYKTISGVRLCWELEEPEGPK